MFDDFCNTIKIICLENINSEELFSKIKCHLMKYKPLELNEIIEEKIDLDYDKIKKNIIQNNNRDAYYKYFLYNSDLFDIVHIKWLKNCESKIHDHPESGCIMFIINDGKLNETIYYNNHNGNIIKTCTNTLNCGDITFIKANKKLHKIKAKMYTESIHIYIPGNYKTNYYSINK
jgi:cysteine dioxygenase